jgi:hypothetical protein
VPVFRLEIPLLGSVPALRFFGLRGRSSSAADAARARRDSGDPLPPVLVVEGEPNPSLRRVIDEAAVELGVTVCTVDTLEGLDDDPDFESVTAVILTRLRGPGELARAAAHARAIVGHRPVVVVSPQPVTETNASAQPIDPSFIAPPVTVERLIYALRSIR